MLDRRGFVAACLGPLLARWLPEPERWQGWDIGSHEYTSLAEWEALHAGDLTGGGFLVPPEYAKDLGQLLAVHTFDPPLTMRDGDELQVESTVQGAAIFDEGCATGYTNTP
jgi:hypothetical protein